ncbi:hypothetical protein A33M_3682 [Rhodovulum sp. PH10]|uniref:TadE/TadG family type IV pilus assembly protein n=1 Tax=Rhodovulum sp. PH10 TaxID=1187851 RepID=UPI00027C1E5E|nr:TadE/TadG family type IV pilus assembly protein [Rhodovulum sp. PH10]EJW10941.1 hypothetical protein A33M_3682 [Rhodovulum sp. PH10]
MLSGVAMIRRWCEGECLGLARFAGNESGVSAVEFALILPIMITLYLGSVEVTEAVSIDRKVTLIAHTVADLTARENKMSKVTDTPSDSDLLTVLDASTAVVSPFKVSPLKVTLTLVQIDRSGRATVAWSKSLSGGSSLGAGDRSGTVTSSIPTAIIGTCTSDTAPSPCTVVWGEASYTYTPAIGYVITGPMTLKDSQFLKPRG